MSNKYWQIITYEDNFYECWDHAPEASYWLNQAKYYRRISEQELGAGVSYETMMIEDPQSGIKLPVDYNYQPENNKWTYKPKIQQPEQKLTQKLVLEEESDGFNLRVHYISDQTYLIEVQRDGDDEVYAKKIPCVYPYNKMNKIAKLDLDEVYRAAVALVQQYKALQYD